MKNHTSKIISNTVNILLGLCGQCDNTYNIQIKEEVMKVNNKLYEVVEIYKSQDKWYA